MKHLRRSEQRKFQYIYKITRTDGSGKYYIGRHSTDDLDDGYFGSGTRIRNSVKCHGKDKHIKEILEFLPTYEALKLREKELVNEELLGDKLCMNFVPGGEGGFTSAQMKKLWENPEYRERVSGKLSKVLIKQWQDPDYKMRIGKIVSARNLELWKVPEHRKKCTDGAARSFIGKHHTDETKQKMSLAASQRVGEKNSQFGSCWVTNGITPIKIRKENLDEYLLNGYSRGRKIHQ